MKLTSKEAYDRMRNGEICYGDDLRYRITKGDCGECLEFAVTDNEWKSSQNRSIHMLHMEWSTLDESQAHIDRLEKRLDDLCGTVDDNTKRVEKIICILSREG